MPITCSAYGCTVRHNKANDISFFRFPLKNEELTKKWVDKMKRDNWYPTRNSFLCSLHFEEKYMHFVNLRRRLLANAVPTLFNFSPPAPRHKKKLVESALKKHLAEHSPDSSISLKRNASINENCMLCGETAPESGRFYFKVPKDPEKCRAWLRAINRLDLLDTHNEEYINGYYRICSLHFDEWCFNSPLRNRIIRSAVPTLELELQANSAVDIQSDPTTKKKSAISHFGQICAVYGCKTDGSHDDCISFYCFPLNEKVCSQWVEKCMRSDLDEVFQLHGAPYMNCVYRICSRHFRPSDFEIPKLSKLGVKQDSIPSLNLPSSKFVAEKFANEIQGGWQESNMRIVSILSKKDSTDVLGGIKFPVSLSESGNQDDGLSDFIVEDVPGTTDTDVVGRSMQGEDMEVVCGEHSYAVAKAQKQCRLCARHSPDSVPIFTSDGITQKLEEKIHKYLPIQVSPSDELPLDVCFSCLKMLNVCHDLVTGSVKADKKLRRALKSKQLQVEDNQHNADWLDMSITEDTDEDEVERKASASAKEEAPVVGIPLVIGDVKGSFVEVIIKSAEETAADQNQQEKTVSAGLRKFRKLSTPDAEEKSSADLTQRKTSVTAAASKAQPADETNEDSEAAVSSEEGEQPLLLPNVKIEVAGDSQCMCPICSEVSESGENFWRHLLLEHTGSLLQCKKCSTIIPASEESLTEHCFSCKRRSLSEDSEITKSHLSGSKETDPEPPNSEQSKEADSKNVSKVYSNVTDVNDLLSKFPNFAVVKIRRASKGIEIKQEIEINSNFSCNHCEENFTSRKELRKHKVSAHFVPQICQFCGKNFRDTNRLKKHEQIHKHSHYCEKCNKMFVGETAVKRHIRFHVEKKYKCGKCGKEFRTWNCLRYHKETHNESKPHLCEICGKSFKHIQSLYVHGFLHKKRFPCEYCGKCFTTASKRNSHQRSHTGERPFVCNVCSKAFTTKFYLTQHIEIHVEERPYECDICGRKWKRLHNMINHKKRHLNQSNGKRVVCKICKCVLSDYKALHSHRNSHTTEEIERHKRKRKNEKECNKCHEFFQNKKELEEHMLLHEELNF